jgi:hypothetical protein
MARTCNDRKCFRKGSGLPLANQVCAQTRL